jgi:hypothetical protein
VFLECGFRGLRFYVYDIYLIVDIHYSLVFLL